VVTPVSNDKILSTNEGKTPASSKREAEALGKDGGAGAPNRQNDTAPATDTVNVERANQLYNQGVKPLSDEAAISSSEQAQEVAATIVQQFTNEADKALRAQADAASGELAILLKAAPT
jgi:hypothetical protein